jgi:Fe-S oxidoreductase
MTKLVFFGCLSKERYKLTCENALKLIKFLDDEYQVIENTPCCGSLTYHIANDQELKAHVNFVNEWFKNNDVTEIVTICAGCYNYLSRYYKEYVPSFNIKVRHILQLIAEPEKLEKLNLKYNSNKMVIAYHDPCHLKNAMVPIMEEPRKILNSIQGTIRLKEMENNNINSLCCGSGGGVYSIFKENSDYNSVLIFHQAKKQRAKVIITPCPFCYTALKRIREDNKLKTSVIKFEDFIVKIMDGGEIS